MTAIFIRLFDYFTTRRFLLFSLVGIWMAVCGWLISGLQFKEDLSSALPDDPNIQKINHILKNSPFLERIYLVVKLKDKDSIDRVNLGEAADTLKSILDKDSLTYFAETRVKLDEDATLDLLDLAYDNAPYYLEEKDYQSIDTALTAENIEKIMNAGYESMLSPAGMVTKKFFVKDPLGITWKGMNQFKKLNISNHFTLQDGYIMTADLMNLMVFIKPVYKAGETGKNKQMVVLLDAAIEKTMQQFPGTEIIYFGAPAVSVANAKQIRKDIFLTVGLALIILITALSIYFRKWYTFLLLSLPPAFGAVTALASLVLIKGSVSSISLGIGSVMLGIILDYSLHTYTHFRENGNARNLLKDISSLLMATSVTTVSAFLCLLTLSSDLLNDLGLFAAISISSAALFTLIVFPHLLKNKPQTAAPHIRVVEKQKRRSFFRKLYFPAFIIILLVSLVYAPKTGFEADLDNLSYMPDKLRNAENYLDEISDFKLKNVYVISEGKDLSEAINNNQQYVPELQKLSDNHIIQGFTSVNIAWPSEQERLHKLALWNAFWTPDKIAFLQEQISFHATQLKIKPAAFDPFFQWIENPGVYDTPEAMEILGPLFFRDIIDTGSGKVTLINIVRVAENKKPDVYSAFGENDLVFDNKYIFNALLDILQKDFNRLGTLSSLLVLIVVWFTFRRVEFTTAIMIPMFASGLIILGLMGFFGINFNIFNIIICTFIFGLGNDYAIFIGRGLLDQFQTKSNNFRSYQTSIVLSVFTTLAGIGVLIFAKHPALKSIAGLSLVGLFSVALISFTILPVLLRFFLLKNNQPRRLPITPDVVFCSVFFLGYFIVLSILLLPIGLLLVKSGLFKNGRKWFEKIVSTGNKTVIYFAFLFKKEIHGITKNTFEKPAIIICNRQSTLDLVVLMMLSGKIRVITKDRPFKIPVLGSIARMLGFYSIHEASQPEFVAKAKKDLDDGYFVMFFPEGTRSEDYTIHRFKKGAFYLAAETGADILPVMFHGISVCMPKSSVLIGPGSIGVKVLPRITADDPLYPKAYSARAHAVCEMFRKEFYAFRDIVETPRFIKYALRPRYIYRAQPVVKAYRKLLKKHTQLKALHHYLGEKETFSILRPNYGELASYLIFRSGHRKITLYTTKEAEQEELDALLYWSPSLEIRPVLYPDAAQTVILYEVYPEDLAHCLSDPGIQKIILWNTDIIKDIPAGKKITPMNGFIIIENHG